LSLSQDGADILGGFWKSNYHVEIKFNRELLARREASINNRMYAISLLQSLIEVKEIVDVAVDPHFKTETADFRPLSHIAP
jgi:hypothetical protein